MNYEKSQQKSYHKQKIPQLSHEQRDLCESMFTLINSMKTKQRSRYKELSALLRSPYQMMFNNLRFVNFVSEMHLENFEYYFRRIVRIHSKCPVTAGHKC